MDSKLRLQLPKSFFKILILTGFASANAQIALWTYEPQNGTITNPTPNTGTGTSAIVFGAGSITPMIRTGMAGTGCGTQNGSQAWAFEPFNPGAANETSGAQFSASTSGYQNITFTWDLRASNTAPNTVRLQYTTNGSTWTNFTMTGANTTFCKGSINANGCFEMDADGDKYRRVSVNLSSITAANNNPNFGVRLLAAHYQSTGQYRQSQDPNSVYGTAGTWRFDNVTIAGTLIPGPNPSVLTAVAPTTLCAGTSGNIKVTMTGGQGPFTVVYSNGSTNFTVNNYTSGNNIPVSPVAGATTTYTLVSVTNANGQAGTGNSSSASAITVRPALSITAFNYSSCSGAVNLNASTSVVYSPAGGVLSYSTAIASPTAYTGGTISSYTYTYTYLGCSVTSAPVTFTRNTTASIITPPSTANETRCYGYAFSPLSVVASADATSYQWYYDTNNTLGGQVSVGSANGGNTATYTPQADFIGTRYYTCRVFNACGNFYTAYSGALTVKSTTWNGTAWSNGIPDAATSVIFTGDYSSGGNLDACTVTVTSGNVVFNPNHTLTIQNGLTVSGGTLTFENNASLVQANNVTNVGDITYKRNTTPVRRYDYTYWSSPVASQILANFSPLTMADKYFWWNTGIYNWNSVAAPGITPMTVGLGYIIRAPQTYDITTPAVWNGAFVGVPNNGNYTTPIAVSGANDLNLVGNPYPSALDADVFLSSSGPNGSVIGGTIYLWTHNTPINPLQYTQSDYAMYNAVGGVGTAGGGTGNTTIPDQYIAAGQAFFVHGTNAGVATFNNSMRQFAGSNDNFYRMSNQQKSRIWLELKNGQGAYKQALVGYLADATNGIDRDFDGVTTEAGNIVSFYSVLENNTLGIQGRSLPFDLNDEVPLGFRTSVAGDFEVSLMNFDGLFQDQDIYLEDKLLEVIHNLKQGDYAFSTAAGTFDARFVLRYTNGTALGNANHDFSNDDLIVYKSGENIIVKSKDTDLQSVTLYDIAGRRLFEKSQISTTEIAINSLMPHGVIIAKIVTAGNVVSERKIIN